MLYTLTCPSCGVDNEIESVTPVTTWECFVCGDNPISSLPTDENNNLIEQVA